MSRRLMVVLLSSACLAAVACGDSKPNRSVPTKAPSVAESAESKQAALAAAQAALPVAEEEAALEYAYSPVGKRDPFRSVKFDEERAAELKKQAEAEAAANQPVLPIENVRCGPLCKWDLEQFRLVAIVSGVSTPMAMLESPDGTGHTVQRGDFIGKRNGKVTQIRPGEVIVTEIYRDNAGVPQPNDIAIVLPKAATDTVELNGDKNLMNGTEEQQ